MDRCHRDQSDIRMRVNFSYNVFVMCMLRCCCRRCSTNRQSLSTFYFWSPANGNAIENKMTNRLEFEFTAECGGERTLQTSTKPPRSFTKRYNLYKSNGCFDIVGQAAIGVRRSSMKLNNLSSQPRRSGLSSMSYNLHRLSDFFDDLCTAGSV